MQAGSRRTSIPIACGNAIHTPRVISKRHKSTGTEAHRMHHECANFQFHPARNRSGDLPFTPRMGNGQPLLLPNASKSIEFHYMNPTKFHLRNENFQETIKINNSNKNYLSIVGAHQRPTLAEPRRRSMHSVPPDGMSTSYHEPEAKDQKRNLRMSERERKGKEARNVQEGYRNE